MKPKERASSANTGAQDKARKAYEETILRAFRVNKDTKEQADVAHKKAIEQAADKRAKEETDIKYKETLEQARKVRDKVMDEAQKAFSDAME
ncbi:MAG: hypothetical protein WC370_01985 [Dehalococcoidales bacterium]|jgi:hypothetical protein